LVASEIEHAYDIHERSDLYIEAITGSELLLNKLSALVELERITGKRLSGA
jgi:hypothetical protein